MIKALDSDMSWGNMLQVGEVARKLGLNPQTLYFYERIGLIPSPKRTEAGYRLFDDQDIERLSFISRAKALGLSLDEIKELLALQDGDSLSCGEVYQMLLRKVQQIEDNIQQLQRLRTELLPLLNRCQENAQRLGEERQCVVFKDVSFNGEDNSNKFDHDANYHEALIMDTLTVEILGTGCKKCHQLEENARRAIASLGIEAEILHITDPVEIAKRRVMSTPALVVNGKVVSKGKVISSEQIKPLFQS
ncbi:redox-active disulfide protein 2, putative [Coleofasciculus chthonoplastes PCC 7420]|uniref:Redox-active disulfide protein 2, putative n=2 Tax=Coleofasciculus chthonoplastes TaxID=64178 RepID=B4VH02_9CYAN|nr:redox-active disulfide protein 2, putative [Coleofasciculus chthonoplastes PCC 7420]